MKIPFLINHNVFIIRLPTSYENNPPIVPSIRKFELNIGAICSFDSLDFILHCMPNLRLFSIAVIYKSSMPLCWRNLFDGYQWQQILTNKTPYLNEFDIFIWINDLDLVSDVNTTLESFDYFTNKYNDWHVAIDGSFPNQNNQSKIIERSYSAHRLFRITNPVTWIQTV